MIYFRKSASAKMVMQPFLRPSRIIETKARRIIKTVIESTSFTEDRSHLNIILKERFRDMGRRANASTFDQLTAELKGVEKQAMFFNIITESTNPSSNPLQMASLTLGLLSHSWTSVLNYILEVFRSC